MKVTAEVVAGFVGSILAPRFDGATASPPFHKECWELCCSDNKFVAIAAPRAHAKSSGITLGYGLATLLFRERKFMLMVSDTEAQAMLFLGTFKQELQENDDLISLFGIKKDENGKVKFVKDSESDIVVEFNDGHRFRIIAKGAEQKLRGLIWNGSRPDIIMCDDMENDELVMNKERRDKMMRWFTGALLPCRADKGIVRMVGTILHMDSLLEQVMPNERDRFTVTEGLKQYSLKRSMWKSVKYRAHSDDFKVLLWPEKKTSEEFMELYEDYCNKGLPDVYSREYLNYPLDIQNAFFRKEEFIGISKEQQTDKLKHYIAGDLAISQTEQADYSVFVVAGIDENKLLRIVDVVRARLDGKEIVDAILELNKIYEPEAIGLEDMQVSKAIGPFLREEMIRTNNFPSLLLLKHGGKDKIMRAKSIQARMRAKACRFDKETTWYPAFENECLVFPRGRNDDQVDAFAYLGMMLDKMVEAPTKEELDEDAYDDEYRESGLSSNGRSRTTGY